MDKHSKSTKENEIKVRKFAAVDIGSNAIRMLIANVIEQKGKPTQFNKSELVRVPIRLGQDAFTVGEISEENIERMVDAIKAYALLMKVYKVEKYMVCATSAMREAYNKDEVVKYVKKKTGIKINVIDGKKEAKIIAATHLHDFIKGEQAYLYIDVGGGSTEFTLFANGEVINSKSFKAGTVRFLNNQVTEVVWDEMRKWVKTHTDAYQEVTLIGSGGNINKLFKLSGKPQTTPLTLSYLQQQYNMLSTMTYQERVFDLGLNEDRADVIIPATRIYLEAMKWSKAKQLYVPKIGLADGIVKAMHNGTL
ncbi:MAG: exopolyphosphatase [Bacteroidota bacterium]|nr:exopolyphosphatase [Bacteroidota bacterium]